MTTREYRNSDGTFTVQSDYILVPSRETHKETLTCVTSYNEEVFTDSVTLDIQCKFVSGMTTSRLQYNTNQEQKLHFCHIFLFQMSRMFWSMGLMETGTWIERTSSWTAKLTPTQPSPCISGDCKYNHASWYHSKLTISQANICQGRDLIKRVILKMYVEKSVKFSLRSGSIVHCCNVFPLSSSVLTAQYQSMLRSETTSFSLKGRSHMMCKGRIFVMQPIVLGHDLPLWRSA